MQNFNHKSFAEIAERLLADTFLNPSTNCLEWVGSLSKGRPMIRINGDLASVRRVVYLGLHPDEDVPDRDTIKNTCKCLRCISPDHMYRASFRRVKPLMLATNGVEDDEDDLEGPDILTKIMTPEFRKTLAEQTVQRALGLHRKNNLAMAWSAAS